MSDETEAAENYLAAEARSRVEIDRQVEAAGWVVQDRKDLNLWAARGRCGPRVLRCARATVGRTTCCSSTVRRPEASRPSRRGPR